MTPARWGLLIGLFLLVALAVPLVRYSLPPCFGDATGHISPECMARWEAAMPIFPQRLVYALGVPMSAVVTFLVLAAGAVLVALVRRRAAA